MNFDELEQAVADWAEDRGIFEHSTAVAQLLKTVSELGELADATAKRDHAGVVDGIGDVVVTLILFSRLCGLNVVDCLQSAYDEIKDRKGRMVEGGVFVKEE